MKRMRRWVLLSAVVCSPMLMGADGCLNPAGPAQNNPVAFCSAAGMFYCNANGGPQTLQAQGYSGYCMIAGNNGNYKSGYSGYGSGNAGTPVYSNTSQAWADCGSTGPTSRGWCLGVITCSRN